MGFFSQRGSHFQFQCSLSQIGVSPSPQLPGTKGLTSSTKACPIYLKKVCRIFLLSLHSHIAALVKLDYLGPNYFKFPNWCSCLLPLPTPKTELRMLLSWKTNTQTSAAAPDPLRKPPLQVEYSLNYFHSWKPAYHSNLLSAQHLCSSYTVLGQLPFFEYILDV